MRSGKIKDLSPVDTQFDINYCIFSVDSLLQIHAIHNLFETMEMQGQSNYADKEQHQNEYERLEWKYLENSSQLVHQITILPFVYM